MKGIISSAVTPLRTILATAALAAAVLPGQAAAHGSMENPISRVYACYLENPERPNSAACIAAAAVSKQALYDWNGVRIGDANGRHEELIPDGELCSAGDATYSALDDPRDDWPATTISPNAQGELDLTFLATAPHAVEYLRVYITNPGYDPLAPLSFAALGGAPFCELTEGEVVRNGNRFELSCPFPSGRSGRHLIYTIWQRSDSPEAFYTCSDVLVDATAGGPGDPPLLDLGAVIANTDLQAGSQVTFRLFNGAGNDAETISVLVDDTTGQRAEWPFALASEVNARSSTTSIGLRDGAGVVTPVRSATENRVFVSAPGTFSFVIDITAPAPSPDPAPGGSAEWQPEETYVAGNRVFYLGVEYEAKWWTRGEVPGGSESWQRITPANGPIPWNPGAVYLAGDEVIFEGVVYRARWWTRGDLPSTSEVWDSGA